MASQTRLYIQTENSPTKSNETVVLGDFGDQVAALSFVHTDSSEVQCSKGRSKDLQRELLLEVNYPLGITIHRAVAKFSPHTPCTRRGRKILLTE
ncbi:hypothetical protein Pan110_53370 [Gimesia panareensis]|nr:hypothetical protein Pan110_53370 [Gimesia panareensis]